MPEPFLIFPWNTPFLPAFTAWLDRLCPDPLAVPLLITPTARPRLALRGLYAGQKKARILPRLITLNEALRLWHRTVTGKNPAEVSELDGVWLLWKAVLRAAGKDSPKAQGPLTVERDLDSFYPWGMKLAALVDEMLSAGLLPQDIPDCEMDVLPGAARLLESLGETGRIWIDELKSSNLTTPGLTAFDAAARLDDGVPEELMPGPRRPVCLMGFHSMTLIEEKLLKALWQAGAHVCLHTDPALATEPGDCSWNCRRHAEWLKDWQAEARLIGPDGRELPPGKAGNASAKPRMIFLAGHDLHSQLGVLKKDLAEAPSEGTSAIILPSAGLLMPLLHHIPPERRQDLSVGISLPLSDTALCRLIRDIFALQQTRSETGDVHWTELLACLDSPVLASITDENGESLQPALRRLRRTAASHMRFVDPVKDLLAAEAFDGRDEEKEALTELLTLFVNDFEKIDGTVKLAEALRKLCGYLRERGENLRELSPADMEALCRLEEEILPRLQHTLLADEVLSWQTVQRIFDALTSGAFLSFEHLSREDESAGPLTAPIQILGVFQSALLSFDRVYVLDATDDALPGSRQRDPLLPDALRAVLGLPELNRRDQEIGYGVHRLCSGAAEVRFYWQEGISRSQLFEGKKSRSRFVDEFLWQMELARNRILEPGKAEELRLAAESLKPMTALPRTLPVQGALKEALTDYLRESAISPSALNDYLSCPASFGFSRLANLQEEDEVNEGDDPAKVGSFLHKVLEDFHRKYLCRRLPDREAAKEELLSLFDRRLNDPSCQLPTLLPPASLARLKAAASRRLPEYIDNLPKDSLPCLLETEMHGWLDFPEGRVKLTGFIDRLDCRGTGKNLVVLDYKTGTNLPSINIDLWKDEDFFRQAEKLLNRKNLDGKERIAFNELFLRLRGYASSLQLPVYIWLCSQVREVREKEPGYLPGWPDGTVSDAVFVPLGSGGKEKSFCPGTGNMKEETRQKLLKPALGRCETIVRLAVRHLLLATELPQLGDEKRCGYCPYRSLCSS